MHSHTMPRHNSPANVPSGFRGQMHNSSQARLEQTGNLTAAARSRSRGRGLHAMAALLLVVTAGTGCSSIQSAEGFFTFGGGRGPTGEAAADTAMAAGDFEAAEAALAPMLSERGGRLTPGDREAIRLLVKLGEIRIRGGKFNEAEEATTRALVLAAPVGAADEPTSQRGARYHLGRVYESVRADDRAEEQYLQALDLCKTDPHFTSAARCNVERRALIRLYVAGGRFSQAESTILEALSAVQAATGAHDIRLAFALADVANFYDRQGKYQLAQPLYSRAADLWRNFREEAYEAYQNALAAGLPSPVDDTFARLRPHDFLFTAPPDLADSPAMMLRLGRVEDAAQLLADERAFWSADATVLAVAARELDYVAETAHDSTAHVSALQTLGYAYYKKGMYASAERNYRQALVLVGALWPKLDGVERREMSETQLALYRTLASITRANGRYEEAVEFLEYARQLSLRAFDRGDARYLDTLIEMTTVQRERGELLAAEELLDNYLSEVATARGTDHPDYAYGLRNKAYLWRARGDEAHAGSWRIRRCLFGLGCFRAPCHLRWCSEFRVPAP